jgi:hypothetical protein
MSEENVKPEAISDEQLEDVAGGLLDTNIQTQNNTCLSQLSSVVQL